MWVYSGRYFEIILPTITKAKESGPNFMALLTLSTESALTEAGNSVLTANVFLGLAVNFCFCACILRVRHSMLTRLTFYAYKASAEVWRLLVSRES